MRLRLALLATLFTGACSGSGVVASTSSSSSSSGGGGGPSTTSSSAQTGSGGATSSGNTGGGADAGLHAAGTIVPLYTDPTDASWSALVAAKQAHPTVTVRAIINPASGPGPSKDPSYASGITKLDAAGVVVLAYVATTYAQKSGPAAHAEIDAYVGWYAGLGGIFFDEMSNTAGDEAYYQELSQYAKSKGLQVTVGNPGADTAESFVGTVDTILVYESGGLPDLGTLASWHALHDKSNFGLIPYAVPALDGGFVTSARQQAGFIYLTDDDLPNPWDSLSSYFPALLGALE